MGDVPISEGDCRPVGETPLALSGDSVRVHGVTSSHTVRAPGDPQPSNVRAYVAARAPPVYWCLSCTPLEDLGHWLAPLPSALSPGVLADGGH